jgi:hypothetical protein
VGNIRESNLNEKEFALEKQVRNWTIPFYKSKGFEVEEIIGIENKKYDLKLKKDGKEYAVEEKAQRKLYDSMCFEIVQDVKTKNWGWIYDCRADRIIYIFWNEEKKEPYTIYKIDWKPCFDFVIQNIKKYPLRISDTGWGITIFSIIPWINLLKFNIAKVYI